MTNPRRTLLAVLLDRSASVESIKGTRDAVAICRRSGFSEADRAAARGRR